MDVYGMGEYDVSVSERVLICLHNLCATSGEMAKTSDDLAHILQINPNEISDNLERHASSGYVCAYNDHEGRRRYYLTNTGIIRVCSIFS